MLETFHIARVSALLRYITLSALMGSRPWERSFWGSLCISKEQNEVLTGIWEANNNTDLLPRRSIARQCGWAKSLDGVTFLAKLKRRTNLSTRFIRSFLSRNIEYALKPLERTLPTYRTTLAFLRLPAVSGTIVAESPTNLSTCDRTPCEITLCTPKVLYTLWTRTILCAQQLTDVGSHALLHYIASRT